MTLLEWLKQQGKALVIQGPQGCGKGLLAMQLAKSEGVCSNVHIEQVCGKNSKFQHWLNDLPDVVIVEGAPKLKHFDIIKPLIANNKILHHRKGVDSVEVKTPMFIFCTYDSKPFEAGKNNRRFYTIKMDA
ncbi:MAG: hypothetical protein KAR42_14715 [candidate division Zixibacteria bacterium]|nr:hypothetical protein [candidate division Zixibacteria bacterium]